uniref:L-lactate permease n=1 Tax=Thermofilum pendens TaxID=2269 RepID=A0A7C4B8H1_THEPE
MASVGVPTAVLAVLAEVDVGQLAAATVVSGSLSLAAIIALVSTRYLGQGVRASLPALALALLFALLGPVTKVYTAAVLGLTGLSLGLALSGGLGRALEALLVLKYYLLLVLLLLAANILGFGGLQYTFLVILAAAVLSQILEGRLARGAIRRSAVMTARSIAAVTLFAVVAELVKRGGYMRSLALVLAETTGPLYALTIPVVGAIGAYATGSATTSNLIFSALQRSYADAVGLDAVALLALQNVGGGLGGMVSPAKIAVAASTTGGRELEPVIFKEGWRALSVAILPQVLVAALLLLYRG